MNAKPSLQCQSCNGSYCNYYYLYLKENASNCRTIWASLNGLCDFVGDCKQGSR